MSKIRVLVVDDSAFMRKVISDILSTDSGILVVGTARNGQDAIKKVEEYEPDVVTMDIEMPVMDGIEALRILMEKHPLPIVMISSLTQEGTEATIRALEWGAVDFIAKPSGPISLDIHKVKEKVITRVKAAAKAKPKWAAKSLPINRPNHLLSQSKAPIHPSSLNRIPHLITIGVSTGGPNALKSVLEVLPRDFPAAIFIVQHMPAKFTKSLSERLDSLSAITVVEAENGMHVKAGYAYIAPGNFHMEVAPSPGGNWRILLNQREPVAGHRPSVDVLFESVSKLKHPSKFVVILTGMGHDGTKGLDMMKKTGCVEAIAEDESSCVIYGMPKSAILSGNVDRILPVHEIGTYLMKKLGM